jgi:hypothetical protein
MKDKLLKPTQHEYSSAQRLVLLFFAGILFLVFIPVALLSASSPLDEALHLPKLVCEPVNGLLGLLFILAGLSFGLWSNYVQFTIGRGTPVPIMATQELIVQLQPDGFRSNPALPWHCHLAWLALSAGDGAAVYYLFADLHQAA